MSTCYRDIGFSIIAQPPHHQYTVPVLCWTQLPSSVSLYRSWWLVFKIRFQSTLVATARGGSIGSRTGCNLKTDWCCMIAFLSCLNFALHILMPILRPCLYLDHALPTLVPQGYSALFVSILSGESKELITTMKARGYSGEKASGMISIRLV